ncbi:RING finger domain-containing protein [Endozoicomonas sp. 4G]|uniref:RING finger domain-containing protein n=1 Tax=Endozoicomonas sp. 4G TaxID=2872754 RepID=UPI0020791990|nr:RING finger domain-containing protein [Endozoicomonas sp. 4G]
MAFFYFSRTDIQHRLSWRFLANKKSMVGIFVLSLLAMMIVPLCYSSNLIDRHHPNGYRVRTEINDGKTRNSTLTMTGSKPAGNVDFPSVGNGGNGGFFYLPPPWGGGGGRPSGLFEIDLTILQPVINWLMSMGKNSVDGRQAANEDGQPSGSTPNAGSNDANNHHQQEQKEVPENQENKSPGEGNNGSGDGNNRKDDNGEESKNNASTQDLQQLANHLLAIIESDDPNAVFKFRELLDELDMPQRLQVLETKGTNISGNTVTPVEAILALPRPSHERSTRNRFIGLLIEAAGNNHQMILSEVVLDIIHKLNQSDQPPQIGHFEKCYFTEYFLQLFLLHSNPVERIRNLLEKISDLPIRNEIIKNEQSLTFPTSFLDTLEQFNQHSSIDELIRLSNELRMQNDYMTITTSVNNGLRVDKHESRQIIGTECAICKDKFERSSNIVKTLCDHLYHVDCLSQWLQNRRQNRAIQDCPTCRTQLNGLRTNLNDFNKLLIKYDGCHSLATATRAADEIHPEETNFDAFYHFLQYCRHSSQASDDSKFLDILRSYISPKVKAEIRHDGKVNSATFSANNQRVVTASDGGTAKIYVFQSDGSWKEEFTIRHAGPVKSASFSADSRRVLTASDDGTAKIHVWKEDGSWEEEITIRHQGPIHSASFSADNGRVLTASDGEAIIYVLKESGSWEEEGSIDHDDPIHLASFSPDGSHVVTVGKDNVVKIKGRSTDGSWQVKFIVLHRNHVNSAIFSPDNRYVVTASNDGTAKIIGQKGDNSWEEEFTISHISTHGLILSAAFSPDSRHVLTVGKDNLVKIIGKQADGSWREKVIIYHNDDISSATFSPDSRHVVTASFDEQAKIYAEKSDVLWEEEITIYHNHRVSSAIFSANSRRAITTSLDGTVKTRRHMNDGSWKEGISVLHDGPSTLATLATLSPNNFYLMTFGDDPTAKINILGNTGKKELLIHNSGPISSATFSANSRFVVTTGLVSLNRGTENIAKIIELWKEE